MKLTQKIFKYLGLAVIILSLAVIPHVDLDSDYNPYELFNLKTSGIENLYPDGATFTLTQLTGVYTEVDEDPDSPDGEWLDATGNNVNTDVLASFGTPVNTPTVGADLQEFRVLVRQEDETQTGTPNARIELWENGGLVRAGSDTPVPDGGVVLSFTWNANELGTSDGSLVECYVYGTKSGGAPSGRNTVEVGAIEWNADTTAGAETDPPTWDTLTESADPLELGNNETIHINVYDTSNIDFVYLEFDGTNHSMNFESGNTYNYTNWKPATVGVHTYQIHMIDEFGNTNQTTDLTITVQDTTDPVISNIIESDDPLELGQTEIIHVDISDLNSMTWVYLEFGGNNYSMVLDSGITWNYTSWTPSAIGNYPYTIWANDTEGNIASDSTGDITVQDTSNPVISNIVESADPLELGNTETIQVDITDESSMYFVYLEFEGANYSMSFVSGITWEYTSWTPSAIGNYPYTIWANDTESNIASDSTGDITVQDTTDPVISNIVESADPLELGNTETIQVDIADESAMTWVYLEFEGANNSMSFVSGITWEYTSWTPGSIGNYPYTIWANDTEGNIASDSTGDITVQDTTDPVISNIVESADPLELGQTEIIHVNISDLNPMTWVYLEFEGANYSMVLDSGITWNYTSWTLGSIGNYPYTIWANDTEGNIASDSTGDITVQDTTDPVISNIVESADPLFLSLNETIHVDITDLSPMYFVYIEIGGVNYTMNFESGITWNYTNWKPTSIGVKTYQIHMIDEFGNTNQTTDLTITVQDTTDPVISNIVESADPLELGNTETIQVDITDESSMYFVYLEFEGANYSMSFVSGITWEYTSWTLGSIGNYPYTIWANDTEGNIASDSTGDITVQDTTDPVISNIVESADPLFLSLNETIHVDITDLSPMYFVYIEIGGVNYTMNFESGITWNYTNWKPLSVGVKPYTIWANDTSGNIDSVSGDITVVDTEFNPPTWDNLKEVSDPSEYGDNITISIDVYDDTNISNVLIEILGNNYTMNNISNTYSYSNWLANIEGNIPYTIYMIDYHGNMNTTSGFILIENTPNIVLGLFILFALMFVMIILYVKIRVFLIILTVFLFSLVMGMMSIIEWVLPLTPFLQLFFVLFQSTLFVITALEYQKEVKIKNE